MVDDANFEFLLATNDSTSRHCSDGKAGRRRAEAEGCSANQNETERSVFDEQHGVDFLKFSDCNYAFELVLFD